MTQFNFRCPEELGERLREAAKNLGYEGRGSKPVWQFFERLLDFYEEYAEDAPASSDVDEAAADAVAEGVSAPSERIEELLERFENPTKDDPFIRALARVSAVVYKNMKKKGEL